jgi:hypothetical protein
MVSMEWWGGPWHRPAIGLSLSWEPSCSDQVKMFRSGKDVKHQALNPGWLVLA